MATFNLVVTYPDGEGTRIMNALKSHWTVNGVVPSNAEAVEMLRQAVVANVKNIVFKEERDAAVVAAAAGVTEVGAT
jgi:hypothetical protein